jgi:Lrp/AsnC family transcriptional regulator, regulator for asnA, asnC and gidA
VYEHSEKRPVGRHDQRTNKGPNQGIGRLIAGPSVPAASPNGLLDDVNKAIVEELQQDGRRTYGSIAEAVGLSEAAVRQRVQKMRDAGIMQIVAVTDPLQVGFRSQAMVGIRADGDARLVADRLSAVANIDYVVMCTGSFDILVELVCEDEDTLLDLLNGVIRQIPGVRDTETFMYLKLTKQTYAWGTR